MCVIFDNIELWVSFKMVIRITIHNSCIMTEIFIGESMFTPATVQTFIPIPKPISKILPPTHTHRHLYPIIHKHSHLHPNPPQHIH